MLINLADVKKSTLLAGIFSTSPKMVTHYQDSIRHLGDSLSRVTKIYNRISHVRLVLGISIFFLFYLFVSTQVQGYAIGLLISAVLFVIFLRWHVELTAKKLMQEILLSINQNEQKFLTGIDMPFEDGASFQHADHAYTNDLDVFGQDSLFQHLNRTCSYIGTKKLAEALQENQVNIDIGSYQGAIKELATDVTWRQKMQALGMLYPDSKEVHEYLMSWSERESTLPFWIRLMSFVISTILFLFIMITAYQQTTIYLNIITLLVFANLGLLGINYKKIKAELLDVDHVNKIVFQYARILKHIEEQPFQSPLLIAIQKSIRHEDLTASEAIAKLSKLLHKLDSINNELVVAIFSGFAGYHIHMLHALFCWRNQHGPLVEQWIDGIGQFDQLSSLANFSYNNPHYVFPDISSKEGTLHMEQMGHPLLKAGERICNDIQFSPYKFVILTGSNMSGKSTFLRSLGINMILTKCGAPICATSAEVHPMPLLASMRVEDSLSDHESYFFAGVNRLKYIMDQVNMQSCLVLLDEILRGTNSDDKRKGTLEVIKKMVAYRATGMIATHDLAVCKIEADHPNYLTNMCFEVEIREGELSFDYTLRPGICQNQSAVFLMKSMGII